MRNVVRWIVTGISGAVGGTIAVLIVAALFYHLLPTVVVLLLQSIPIFVASLADLWWALCVFLALLVVWAMSDEGATSPYAGPVLRGRKPTNRSPLWSEHSRAVRRFQSLRERVPEFDSVAFWPRGVADWALEPRPLP